MKRFDNQLSKQQCYISLRKTNSNLCGFKDKFEIVILKIRRINLNQRNIDEMKSPNPNHI